MTDPGWVVTCDPGTDDAIALAVAAGHPDCQVIAVVAGAGNVDAHTAWRNAAGIVRLLGLDVPVGLGGSHTLAGTAIERTGGTHGGDGLAGLADLLPDRPGPPDGGDMPSGPRARGASPGTGGTDGPEAPGERRTRSGCGPSGERLGPGRRREPGTPNPPNSPATPPTPGTPGPPNSPATPPTPGTPGPPNSPATPPTPGTPDRPDSPARPLAPAGSALVQRAVIALGPLSDVARARRAGQAIGPLVWMGGTTTLGGNGEFNAGADAAAADEILDTVEDLAVVPVDVTRLVTFGAADIDRWSMAGGPGARLCAALARARSQGGTATLHDPVAMVAAVDPHLFTWERRCLRGAGDAQPPGTLVSASESTGRSAARLAVAVDVVAVRDRITNAILRT